MKDNIDYVIPIVAFMGVNKQNNGVIKYIIPKISCD